MTQKIQKNQQKSLRKEFLQTFKDRYGHLDPKALTAFVSFCVLIFAWVGDQFFGKKLNETIINVFAFLVFSLLGLKVLPWKKEGMKTEQEQSDEDLQNMAENEEANQKN